MMSDDDDGFNNDDSSDDDSNDDDNNDNGVMINNKLNLLISNCTSNTSVMKSGPNIRQIVCNALALLGLPAERRERMIFKLLADNY